MKSLGFNVSNDIFAENAWYFRNSLVRANYNDYTKGIRETTCYLELFLRNLLLGESHELKNRYLHIRWTKQDIEIPEAFSKKTKQHIQVLFAEYGNDKFFGRTDVMGLLKITASPSSELIKKMIEADLIIPMTGKGKGKYLFKSL